MQYKSIKLFRKFLLVRLFFFSLCCIVIIIGKRNLADVYVTSKLRYYIESKGVRLMVKIWACLIIGLMISLTINVTLLCIIYIQWVNKQI